LREGARFSKPAWLVLSLPFILLVTSEAPGRTSTPEDSASTVGSEDGLFDEDIDGERAVTVVTPVFLVPLDVRGLFVVLGCTWRCPERLGGVGGAFSFVLEDDDWVGRIIRARKPSSTCFSLWAEATLDEGCFGGGPTVGRDPWIEEGCFLIVRPPPGPFTLTLLAGRPEVVPELRPPDRLPDAAAPFDTDDAVGAIRDDGKLTGFVGDFGFGLTNPDSDTLLVLIGPGFCAP